MPMNSRSKKDSLANYGVNSAVGFVVVQQYAFLAFVVCGMAVGIVFCILNTVSAQFKKYRFIRVLIDISFWLFAIAVFLACTWFAAGGALRLFALLAYSLGALVSYLGPGRYIAKLMSYIFTLIKKAIASLNALFIRNPEENSDK